MSIVENVIRTLNTHPTIYLSRHEILKFNIILLLTIIDQEIVNKINNPSKNIIAYCKM